MSKDKLLIISSQWPEPLTTAAGMRMWQLIRCFKDNGFELCFSCTAEKTKFSANLGDMGVMSQKILLNDSSFDQWVSHWNPDVVIFDRFMMEEQYGWRVTKCCPHALRVLDTEDLHSLRVAREEAFAGDINFTTELWLSHPNTLRELASIYRSDLSLVISSHEMAVLTELAGIPEGLLYYLPFLLDPISEKNLPPFEQRSGFICVGNGRHRPNIDAITHLYNDLWPGIRAKLPLAHLSVFGAYLPQAIKNLNDPARGFHIEGWTANLLQELTKFRVQLAPLRFGAGIKGKLADSMRSGTPSVTTPVGAEGMHGQLPWGGLVTTAKDQFINAAVLLHEDRREWLKARTRGCKIVNSVHQREKNEAGLMNLVERVRSGLENHRHNNLVGAMMRHHRMGSTMYLSKWIACKKKLLREDKPAN